MAALHPRGDRLAGQGHLAQIELDMQHLLTGSRLSEHRAPGVHHLALEQASTKHWVPTARAAPLANRKLPRPQALQDPQRSQLSIPELMQQCGLLACGATARRYRQIVAETPRQTRL